MTHKFNQNVTKLAGVLRYNKRELIREMQEMNAAKKIRKLIEGGEDIEQIAVLRDLASALEFGREFQLTRLYDIDHRYFELAVELIGDWRFDQHINSRSRLTTLLSELTPGEAEGDKIVDAKDKAEVSAKADDGAKDGSAKEADSAKAAAGKGAGVKEKKAAAAKAGAQAK